MSQKFREFHKDFNLEGKIQSLDSEIEQNPKSIIKENLHKPLKKSKKKAESTNKEIEFVQKSKAELDEINEKIVQGGKQIKV